MHSLSVERCALCIEIFMLLFPAIDILNKRAVRLMHGDYNKVTDYGCPVQKALDWQSQGAQFLHVVDLLGAKEGMGIACDIVAQIVKSVKIPVQLGGGIRTLVDIKNRLNSTGVSRVILGTVCCSKPEIVKQAVKEFGSDKIVAGIDIKDGFVATSGWLQTSKIKAIDLGKKMREFGLEYCVFTDISRDGALTGGNISLTKEFSDATGLNCIVSGGIASLDDLTSAKQQSLYGAILGRAIYENKFSVSQAIAL